MEELISRLVDATIGDTFNFYREGGGAETRRNRLIDYLRSREAAPLLLVGEAAGYRGARVSGIPFTSERQLTGSGPAEASATIVHCVLADLGIEEDVLLWNVVPTHPGTEHSNRRPTRAEVEASLPYLGKLARGRLLLPVGRLAHAVLGDPYIRHPSHGGASAFRDGMRNCVNERAGSSEGSRLSVKRASPTRV